jgi:hypothetical protein
MAEKYSGVFGLAIKVLGIGALLVAGLGLIVGVAVARQTNFLNGLLNGGLIVLGAFICFALANACEYMLDMADIVDRQAAALARQEKLLNDIQRRVEYTRRKVSGEPTVKE